MISCAQKGTRAILLMSCPDQQGIVANVTDFIHVNGGNIISLDQHIDHVENVFFMRVEWDIDNFTIPCQQIGEYFNTLQAKKFNMSYKVYFSNNVPRMAVFVSKMGHCLYDILSRYALGEWQVEIPIVISNHEDMRPVAEKFGIPYHHIPVTAANREEKSSELLRLLAEHEINFMVLARYMQIMPQSIIEAYPDRIINIHHSFLPAFVGAKPYHAAFERGVKIIGATSHYVTPELDAGPIIYQDIAHISHKNSVEDLILKGRDLEKIVLARAVEKHIERKVLTYNNKTVVF